jgi:sterol desaturase/sphingolipid hydroxylase (fatty acid hydroxylase superfamily)
VILTPAHHRLHHCEPYRQAFCITTGLLDPLLDRARIFERIELAVRGSTANPGGGPRRPSAARIRKD